MSNLLNNEQLISDFIDTKVESKEKFSVHSFVNENKDVEIKTDDFIDSCLKDNRLTAHCFIVCDKCGASVGDSSYDKNILGTEKKCYFCNNSFKIKNVNIELVFDPQTLKEKIKLI